MAIFKKKPTIRQRTSSAPGSKEKVAFSYYGTGQMRTGTTKPRNEPEVTGRWQHALQRAGTILLVGVVLVSFIYSILINPKVRLLDIPTSSSGAVRPVTDYETALNNALKSSVFNYTKLTIRPGDIERDIKKKFPEVTDVDIALPLLGQHPAVSLTFAKPTLQMTIREGTFIIGNDGRVLMPAAEVAATAKLDLAIVRDESDLPATLGANILSSDETAFLDEVRHQLKEKGITVQSMVLPAIPKELHVRLSEHPYLVKFYIDGKPGRQVGALLAVKRQLEGQGKVPAEYIDVRVEERVFVK